MQVFFGQYMQKAGAIHGDMSGSCKKTPLAAPIQCIEFFYGTDVSELGTIVGVNATMWPARDGSGESVTLQSGKVGTIGSNMFKYCWPKDESTDEFFGFESFTSLPVTDSITGVRTGPKIESLKIIGYNPKDLFGKLFDADH